MTRRKVTVIECDIDKSADNVTSWTLRPEGGSARRVDLCALHATPLVQLYKGGGRTRAGMAATTLEEIEASKAPKKTAARTRRKRI